MPKQIADMDVFHAVARVLRDVGYARASTAEMASQAGISEMTLFRKYKSKANLVTAAITAIHKEGPLAKISASDDLEDDIAKIIEAHVEAEKAYGPLLAVLLAEAPGTPELRPALEAPVSHMRSIAAVLEHHQTRGHLKQMPIEVMVNALMAPLIVRGMMLRAQGGAYPSLNDIAEIVSAFLDGHRT